MYIMLSKVMLVFKFLYLDYEESKKNNMPEKYPTD